MMESVVPVLTEHIRFASLMYITYGTPLVHPDNFIASLLFPGASGPFSLPSANELGMFGGGLTVSGNSLS